MAKAKSPDDVILDCLRKAIEALPELMPLYGSKSLFSAKQADLAERAVRDGYIAKKEIPSAGGKGKKPTVVALITEAGARKVAEAGGTQNLKGVLELLRSSVEKISHPSAPPDPAIFRPAIEAATTACVNAINTAFAGLRDEVLCAVAPVGRAAPDPAPILAAIKVALSKVEPTIVKVPVIAEQHIPGPALVPLPPPEPGTAVADEIVAFVEGWTREKTVGPPFDALMKHLRTRHPDLTVGAFHDTLRRLTGGNSPRIRLSGWSKTIHELPDPELALFVKHTVMYYAHPPQ